MSRLRARVDAMRPAKPGATRTAPPRPPDGFPGAARYRGYLMFGAGGALMMVVAANLFRSVWALMNGEAAFRALMLEYRHPAYVLFHLAAFVWLVWLALRFFALFPKTQPFRLGPFRRPPDVVLVGALAALFVVITLLLTALLVGVRL